MVFFLRKSGANTVVLVVYVVIVEVALIVNIPRVVRIVAIRRTTLSIKVNEYFIKNSYMSKTFLHELQYSWRYFEQTPIFSKIISRWWVVKHDASLTIDVKKSIVFNLALAFLINSNPIGFLISNSFAS